MDRNKSKEQTLIRGEIVEISCNLDDMTAEDLGYVLNLLMEEGARDAYTIPVGMKKCRPGVLLTCICECEDEERMADLILRHTTSLGVRVQTLRRYMLHRKIEEVDTPLGRVRIKTAYGNGIHKEKAEFDDLKRLAKENQCSIREIRKVLEENYERN